MLYNYETKIFVFNLKIAQMTPNEEKGCEIHKKKKKKILTNIRPNIDE